MCFQDDEYPMQFDSQRETKGLRVFAQFELKIVRLSAQPTRCAKTLGRYTVLGT